ncbi:MAG: hypothetical protein CVV24_10210 [Ignavibacteriae bacterium HGW-Ignavibacteriae-3]|nr:MAG: hypothetical protein CVV24_10210 [Ignavibacteriae bacterium HGW-Ignavibacteriae-3]
MPQDKPDPGSKTKAAIDKLFSLHQFGMKLGLDNMRKLLDEIGNPQKNLEVIHIAGSNGKGSTASFIASILMESGYKVGLYTSPHFVKFNERIRINSRMIEDDYVSEFVFRLEHSIDKNGITFFEITTAMAFQYFLDQKVDYAVIETGLGGRLDATNVVNPIASVITSISLEHTQHLGETIEKIATEKAGIIKTGAKVFTGMIPLEAEKVFLEKTRMLNCDYYPLHSFASRANESISVNLGANIFSIYSTPLLGEYQLYNAALAVKTVDLSLAIKDGLIFSRGIKNVLLNSGIEGRYEIINDKPKIIFDSAHNPEGVASFTGEFSKEYRSYKERVLVFGAMRDKSIRDMLTLLDPYFSKIILTGIDMERSATSEELKTIADSCGISTEINSDPVSFITAFRKKEGDSCLVVLGSMYLLGEIKSKMFAEKA